MKKTVITIILVIVAIAAIIWACSVEKSGLAWFPGFFIAVACSTGILNVNKIGQSKDVKRR